MSFLSVLDAAVAGTQRHPDGVTETVLLREAAFEGMRRLAGRQLATGAPPPFAPSPGETRAEVSPTARARLLELLDERDELVPEWLQLVARHGMRIPHDALPDVLDYARSTPAVQDVVSEAGGERLPWLAAQNPEWSFAAPFDAEERFAFGTRDERIRALRRIRHRDPSRARELLAEVWVSERADTLAPLLALFIDGVSSEDEPLLERARSSGLRELRASALHVLRYLPEAQFAQRWIGRARAMLDVGVEGVRVLEPSPVPDDWIADGLDARAPLLQQVLAFALPALWQRDPGWCERLLQHVLETHIGLAVGLLDTRRQPLSAAFSAILVRQVFASLGRWGYPAASLLRDLPLRLDPCAATDVRALLDTFTEPAWAWPYLERIADTLDIRAAMRQELQG